jgi:hypothetical protein
VPSRGGVIRRTDFEYVALKAAQWSTASGEGREPAPVGMQHGKYPLSSCRIRTAAGRYVAGKLYLAGAHAGHCYVPLDGREEDYTSGFETLTLPR